VLLLYSPTQGPPEALAKQVLAEVPDQVCRYFQLNNIPPGAPQAAGQAPATGQGFFSQFAAGAQPQPGPQPQLVQQ
jgi:hypothetical protein